MRHADVRHTLVFVFFGLLFGIQSFDTLAFRFSMKERNSKGETRTVEMTVYNFFQNIRKITLTRSASLPCLDVGKPDRPIYLPIEVCDDLYSHYFSNYT